MKRAAAVALIAVVAAMSALAAEAQLAGVIRSGIAPRRSA
jgi:hypothetical protein